MIEAPRKPTWDELKELLRWFAVAFGKPGDLWRDEAVARRLGLSIRGWLCALEAFARALLVMMAAGLPKPAPTPRRPARTRRPPSDLVTDDIVDVDAALSESDRWAGVAFALAPPARRKRDDHAKTEPRGFIRTRRLAYRFEALIRVAENPERYAARMARRLHARPKLAYRVLRRPRPFGCDSCPEEDVGRAQGFAWFAAETFGQDTG